MPSIPKIKVTKDGPYFVSGNIPLVEYKIKTNDTGESIGWERGKVFSTPETYTLCRCGKSKNPPFCDGSHIESGFDGTETADFECYLDGCETILGGRYQLKDKDEYCAGARHCDTHGGAWALIEELEDKPELLGVLKHQCESCPSGRLVLWDSEKEEALEPDLEPEIGVVFDSEARVGGPLWLRGGILIESADGRQYEVRNRATLCRCGASENKPFCDGGHIRVRYLDEK
jgi:CDGSH-type Zn-finger protein